MLHKGQVSLIGKLSKGSTEPEAANISKAAFGIPSVYAQKLTDTVSLTKDTDIVTPGFKSTGNTFGLMLVYSFN